MRRSRVLDRFLLTSPQFSDILIVRSSENQIQGGVIVRNIEVQVVQRGLITLPKALRDTYGIRPGDTLTLLDLGGIFVLSPRRSEVDTLADRLGAEWQGKGETLESMLQVLREERARYGE
jgi:AbrB family looped-hinge helix DNA binding protein